MEHLRNLVITVVLPILLLIIGTIGYTVIEGWRPLDAAYMTVITLATVGYGEVHGISPAGRYFTMVLLLVGVTFFLYVIGQVVQAVVEGRILAVLGKRKLDWWVKHLKGHYIICGYGRIGRVLTKHLTRKGLKVAVVENSPEKIVQLEKDQLPFVAGDANEEKILTAAGIINAKGLLTALPTDPDNVFLVLSARKLNPDLLIVARSSFEETKKTLKAAGADQVISPYDIGARRMAHAVLRPAVIRLLELAFMDDTTNIELEELQVTPQSSLVGVLLKDSGLRQDLNLIVISIQKVDGRMEFNPSAESRIEAGDVLIVMGETGNLEKLMERL